MNFLKIKHIASVSGEYIQLVGIIIGALIIILTLGTQVFAPLFNVVIYPVATIIAVILGTIFAFKKRTTAIMSVSGIILYLASWLIYEPFGIWASQLISGAGILLWIFALLKSFRKRSYADY